MIQELQAEQFLQAAIAIVLSVMMTIAMVAVVLGDMGGHVALRFDTDEPVYFYADKSITRH